MTGLGAAIDLDSVANRGGYVRIVCIPIGFILVPLASARFATAQIPCTTPASQRTAEIGCYFSAAESLGVAPNQPLFWHLYTYRSRAAAEAARHRGIVVESLGKVWVYTIAGAEWRPDAGERVAVVGPLPVTPGKRYTARYMEAVFLPGMKTRVHRHSGPEAWYVLSGAQCLETPDGLIIAHAGQSAVVRPGPPMVLSTTGAEARRAVLIVLHETSQPWTTAAHDWKPRGMCPR
jgi:quercetin dioxygenase-like cupin family protein